MSLFERIKAILTKQAAPQPLRRIAPMSLNITAHMVMNEPSDELCALWSEATAAASQKDYARAVAAMERVREIQIEEDGEPRINDEIRRAKYLQFANRGTEAWELYSVLIEKYENNEWLIIDLLDAMRLHLQREGNSARAINYGVAHRLARVRLYRNMKLEAETAPPNERFDFLDKAAQAQMDKTYAQLNQSSAELGDRWIAELTDPKEVQKLATGLCRKAGTPDRAQELANTVLAKIESEEGPFDHLTSVGEWRA